MKGEEDFYNDDDEESVCLDDTITFALFEEFKLVLSKVFFIWCDFVLRRMKKKNRRILGTTEKLVQNK